MTTATFEDPRAQTILGGASHAGFATVDFVAFAVAALMVLGPLFFGALGGS